MSEVTTVGDTVKLKKDNLVGVVRFVGEIQRKKGIFFGIELDDAKGKNNGTVGKVAYFKCKKMKGIFIKDTQIAKTNTKNNKDALRVTVGDTVKCRKQKCNGKIRFIGTPYSVKKDGIFYGVQLDKPNGKNNGTVKGRWYFTTKPKHGAFVTAGGISLISEEKKDAEPEPKKMSYSICQRLGLRLIIQPKYHQYLGQMKECHLLNLTRNSDAGNQFIQSDIFQLQIDYVAGLANICAADGILSDLECAYLKRMGDGWNMVEEQYNKSFNPQTYSNFDFKNIVEMCQHPMLLGMYNDSMFWKKHFMHHGILAAAQDGLEEDELQRAYEIGSIIGINAFDLDNITLAIAIEKEAELLQLLETVYITNPKI